MSSGNTVHKKNYFLAHSIDLRHPDYVNVKLNDPNSKTLKDDEVFYDNKKDTLKIQNRSYSPEEIREAGRNALFTNHASKDRIRNIEASKDHPLSQPYFQKDSSAERFASVRMERKDDFLRSGIQSPHGFVTHGNNEDTSGSQALFPLIKSSTQGYLNMETLNRLPQEM